MQLPAKFKMNLFRRKGNSIIVDLLDGSKVEDLIKTAVKQEGLGSDVTQWQLSILSSKSRGNNRGPLNAS